MTAATSFLVFVLYLLIIVIILALVYARPTASHEQSREGFYQAPLEEAEGPPIMSCSGAAMEGDHATSVSHTCGAIDPVGDPVYNMKEIIKQSLLLEEHLVEKNKRCHDCTVKHFLTIVALAEEALSLAGKRVKEYDMMEGNVDFYNRLYERWLQNRLDDSVIIEVAEQLRQRRKQLVATFILS